MKKNIITLLFCFIASGMYVLSIGDLEKAWAK